MPSHVRRCTERVSGENDIKVSFADMAGVDESKDALKEIVDFLKLP